MPDDFIVLFINDQPFTAKDLGDDLLDEDLRTVFQTMIDRGLVQGVPAGSPWHEHIRMDSLEHWVTNGNDDILVKKLVEDRKAAEKELLETYTDDARAKLVECQRRVRMAKKLISD